MYELFSFESFLCVECTLLLSTLSCRWSVDLLQSSCIVMRRLLLKAAAYELIRLQTAHETRSSHRAHFTAQSLQLRASEKRERERERRRQRPVLYEDIATSLRSRGEKEPTEIRRQHFKRSIRMSRCTAALLLLVIAIYSLNTEGKNKPRFEYDELRLILSIVITVLLTYLIAKLSKELKRMPKLFIWCTKWVA